MVIVTSVSPNHLNAYNQVEAIKSWNIHGECFSLNTVEEKEKLEPLYSGITFIETRRTIEKYISKKLVRINAMIDFAKVMEDDLLIINSDIILTGLPELKDDGISIMSRYDYTTSFKDAKKFELGFDVFHIPHKVLNIFPPAIYALGAAWHDLSTPYRAILNNVPIYYPEGRYAFHKIHITQYSYNEWCKIGEYFRNDFAFSNHMNLGQVATEAMALIKAKLI